MEVNKQNSDTHTHSCETNINKRYETEVQKQQIRSVSYAIQNMNHNAWYAIPEKQVHKWKL